MMNIRSSRARAACAVAAILIAFHLSPTRGEASLIITGVLDGTLGSDPKLVEIFALNAIPSLSQFNLQRFTDGNPTPTTLTLSGSMTQGSFLYIVDTNTTQAELDDWFGRGAITIGTNALAFALPITGDDPLRLRTGSNALDHFGVIGTDGTGQIWEYTDGFAYRKNGTLGDNLGFNSANWIFSGDDALDGAGGDNGGNGTPPFPLGTYSPVSSSAVPEPGSLLLAAFAGLMLLAYSHVARCRARVPVVAK